MPALTRDLRYAARSLRQRPVFLAVSAATLALGIGANTAMFSLVRGVLLRPLPYEEADRMVELWNRWEGTTANQVAVPEYSSYRQSGAFAALAGFVDGFVHLTGGGGEPERVAAVAASADVFAVLGVEARLGRVYGADEDRPGGAAVAVLSYELWQRRFGGDPGLVGETITVDGEPTSVLGVLPPGCRMPRDFQSGRSTDVWLPLRLDPTDQEWGMHFLTVLGRLADGVSLAEARSEMAVVVQRMKQAYAGAGGDGDDAMAAPSFGVRLDPVLDAVVAPVRPALAVLLAAVLMVLLIACANVVNLELVRGELRRPEIALRSALGAGRVGLVRQLLTESLLLALIGGGGGVLLGVWILQLFIAVAPAQVPRLDEVRLDGGVLAFSLALSLASGLLVGLLPALRMARTDPGGSLKVREASGRGRRQVAVTLVVAEVALAVALVVCAALLLQSFFRLRGVDPGYDTEGVLTVGLELPEARYPQEADVARFFAALQGRLQALPGVTSAGASTHLPLADRRGDWNFYPEGRLIAPGEPKPRGDWSVVTPGYFESMRIPLLDGRPLTAADDGEAPLVLLVNRTLAETYWPDSTPVGSRVRLGGNDDNPFATIVGVVADARDERLDREPVAELYLPLSQAWAIQGWVVFRALSLVVRTEVPPETLTPGVRTVIGELDDQLPVALVQTMAEVRAASLSLPRFAGSLVASFAAVALVLGAVGVFGVLYHMVAQRRRELGIRIALGADRSRLLRMVLGQGLRLTLSGLALGGLLGVLGSRLLAGFLYGIGVPDVQTFAAVALTLGAAGTLACWLPARRAAKVDPIRALREE